MASEVDDMDLITTHLNADFDGLASMVAARKLYPDATLVLSGGAEETVRSFLAVHDLSLTRLKDLDVTPVTRLILVDTQEAERLGPLKDLCTNPHIAVHVYDHHPGVEPERSESLPPYHAELYVVEPVGATVTLLVERLRARQVPLTPFEATVLALGLYEETGSMAYATTTPRDLEAAAYVLHAGADLNMVSDVLRRPLDPEQVALLNTLLQTREAYYLDGRKVLLASSTSDHYRGDLAEAVQKLAEMEGVDAVVVAIAMDDRVELIGRSRSAAIDVGELARAFGGGGHAVAAAASIKGHTVVEVKERLVQLLLERYRPPLLAKDVMTAPVKTISAVATVATTDRTMTQDGVNTLPVVDQDAHYQGLVTRELVQKAMFYGFANSPMQDFMRTDQYTAALETPFHDIETRMLERHQRCVPILTGPASAPQVVGIITRTDVLRVLHDDMLLAARARATGQPAAVPSSHRNVRGLMRAYLPARVYALLERAGVLADHHEVSLYVVGGFVRDLLLRRANLDLDLVVEGDGIAFARALSQALEARIHVHERFGTAVLILPDDFKLDVATARMEYYEYPTALPTVAHSSIQKDLYRRDFTINTLAIRLNGRHFGALLDFYGGQRDLKDHTIRVLHSLSFVEDPTRMLRAIRFVHRFGFHLGKETLALIKGAVKMELLHRLSGHRLCTELILLCQEKEPRQALAQLGALDLLQCIHPSLRWSSRLHTLLKAVEEVLDWYTLLYLDRPIDVWLVYCMALLEVLPAQAVEETIQRLTIPKRYAEKMRAAHASAHAILPHLVQHPAPRPAAVYRLLAGLADETLLLLMAKTTSDAARRQISAYLTTYQHIKPMLTGADLHAMGFTPGPRFTEILESLRDARLNGDVTTVADERALVQQTAQRYCGC
jgi:tRNA nucleotidyltransferase (CCA-adding enzyme)